MDDSRVLLGSFLGPQTEYDRLHRTVFIVSMLAMGVVAAGWGMWEAWCRLTHRGVVSSTDLWLPWALAFGCAGCAAVALAWGRLRERLTGAEGV